MRIRYARGCGGIAAVASDAGAVFIDTAVLMYAGGAPHPLQDPCRDLLELLEQGVLRGVTSAEIVQEILHRFQFSGDPGVGERMARVALDLFAPVLPLTHAVMTRGVGLVATYPSLTARDAVHVATCIEEGVTMIVSPDRGFDDVAEIRRVDPADRAAVLSLTRGGSPGGSSDRS